MAKPTLSQTQRNQALKDLKSIVSEASREFDVADPCAKEFLLKHVSKTITLSSLIKFVTMNATYRNGKYMQNPEVKLLEAFKLEDAYKKIVDKRREEIEQKRSKFNEFAKQQEMVIKYGENVDQIMAAFKAIENYGKETV